MRNNNLAKRGGQKSLSQRLAGPDIIRSCAILFVIAGHFTTLNTPFRTTDFGGFSMFLQTWSRELFLTGVPLFLMLTGFLNTGKTVSRKYFKGMGRVLSAYLFFALLTLTFKTTWLHENISPVRGALKILDFSAIPYGWYIEMWIGLYLLTPFLNLLYRNIGTQRHKLLLIGILAVMTFLPDFCNRYDLHIVPGYWANCYPLAFYFIGSYIREYRPRPQRTTLCLLLLGLTAISPVFNLLFIHNRPLVQITGNPGGIIIAAVAVLFFLLFYEADLWQPSLRKAFATVSLLSLDVYLCCYIFDALYYPWFINRYFESQAQFGLWFFVIVPLVFLSSLVLARIKETLFRLTRIDRLWS